MRENMELTINAGTPINLATGMTAAQMLTNGYPASGPPEKLVTRIFIQMQHGGTGLGYVMDGIYAGRTPASTNATDVTAELAPATAGAPGGSYSDQDLSSGASGINLARFWIDGSNTGDKVKVSYDLRSVGG